MDVIVIGGGIAGLAFALGLKQRGISCRVFETAPELKALGVGITLLPHAVRELSALGLEPRLREVAIENTYNAFFNRYGQLIYKELRGKLAGYPFPELGIHRGNLHMVLLEAATAQLGADSIQTNHHCTGVEHDEQGVTVHFTQTTTGARLAPIRGDIAIACDGVNSVVRKQFYPDDALAFGGINMWRGVVRHPPILDGRTYMRVGAIDTGKLVIFPIVDADDQGNQLINWVAELRRPNAERNDWNKPGKLEDFFDVYKDWRFDWLDVADLISKTERILEYPMVDKDPVERWTFGRVTLMGDAAHPMYPRGANGAAQALIDSRTLADLLIQTRDPREALTAYEAARLETTATIVRTNRVNPPDVINTKVDALSGGKPFRHIDDLISQEELKRICDDYAQIAGFSREAVNPTGH